MNCPHCDQPISPSSKEKFLSRVHCPLCGGSSIFRPSNIKINPRYYWLLGLCITLTILGNYLVGFLQPQLSDAWYNTARFLTTTIPLFLMVFAFSNTENSGPWLEKLSKQQINQINVDLKVIAGIFILLIFLAGAVWWLDQYQQGI